MVSSAVCLTAGDDLEWSIVSEFGTHLYPSVIVATATFKPDEDEEPAEDVLGDPMGMLGAAIVAPQDDAKVKVTVESDKLIKPSSITVDLPEEGKEYWVYPVLRYDYDTLLRVRQPFPEVVSIKVSVDGGEPEEKQERMVARSVNDCPFGIMHEDGDYTPLDVMFAAYVNENHPIVDEILSEALNSGEVEAFAGYQGDADAVLKEMEAVWNVLKRRGFSYSSITQPSVYDDSVYAQHVRLIGDSVKTAQANCVDGTVLLASVFMKLGLKPFLVSIPGHMFLGVYLDDEESDFACIETTMLSSSTFEEAVKAGNESFREHEDGLLDEDSENPSYSLVDIAEARQVGVLPLREPGSE
ncbi:MAG: hypothetical protein SFU53_12125 [Terrimicrobiaceae bacterium]|nr:hypothetical protein [Terrimicrobiaceae bacterium]